MSSYHPFILAILGMWVSVLDAFFFFKNISSMLLSKSIMWTSYQMSLSTSVWMLSSMRRQSWARNFWVIPYFCIYNHGDILPLTRKVHRHRKRCSLQNCWISCIQDHTTKYWSMALASWQVPLVIIGMLKLMEAPALSFVFAKDKQEQQSRRFAYFLMIQILCGWLQTRSESRISRLSIYHWDGTVPGS